jgi:hypothetical protein
MNAFAVPSLATAVLGDKFQFERLGKFPQPPHSIVSHFTFPRTDLTHCSASMLFQVILPWTRIQGQRTLCSIELLLCVIHLVKLELSDSNLRDTVDNEESVVMY